MLSSSILAKVYKATSIFVFSSLLSDSALAVPTVTGSPLTREMAIPGTNTSVDGQEVKLALIHNLILALNALDRMTHLPNDIESYFGFTNPPANTLPTRKDGHANRADRECFFHLIGTNVCKTLGFLGPCGFNTPHIHPRSSEIHVMVNGTLVVQFKLENGAKTVTDFVKTNQMTIFPQGALHTEWNPDRTGALFVAGFAGRDPGVQQEAQTCFGLATEAVGAAVGKRV